MMEQTIILIKLHMDVNNCVWVLQKAACGYKHVAFTEF